MPAHDECEPAVVAALEKAGFRVTRRQYPLRIPDPFEPLMYADLRLVSISDENRVIIVVEVKCFPDVTLLPGELYRALGQYQMYRTALQVLEPHVMIYLAVPHDIYEDEMTNHTVSMTLQFAQVKLIVVNLETEEIVAWIG